MRVYPHSLRGMRTWLRRPRKHWLRRQGCTRLYVYQAELCFPRGAELLGPPART